MSSPGVGKTSLILAVWTIAYAAAMIFAGPHYYTGDSMLLPGLVASVGLVPTIVFIVFRARNDPEPDIERIHTLQMLDSVLISGELTGGDQPALNEEWWNR
jgi:hypothetical protein